MTRSQWIVLSHALQAVGRSNQPVHDRSWKTRVHNQELGRLSIGVEAAIRAKKSIVPTTPPQHGRPLRTAMGQRC
jgi:hypothetical protein